MKTKQIALSLLVTPMSILLMGTLIPGLSRAAEINYHHVHITASSPTEGIKWYMKHMDCSSIPDRSDAADCGGVKIVFIPQPTMGGTQGTGVNHISFSFPNLTTKMADLEAVGVYGTGVRLQRFADGSTLQAIPELFKIGFIFDPWGTRIALVEDQEYLGFHHIHLSTVDPEATLTWYQEFLGGQPASLRGQLDGLLFNDVWMLASKHTEGTPAPTKGRAIDHIAFEVSDLDLVTEDMREGGVNFTQNPMVPEEARTSARRAFITTADNVKLAIVETGWAGIVTNRVSSTESNTLRKQYEPPMTPWAEPDIQGVWTANSAHGIPLERPNELLDIEKLTPEEAAARRERRTLGSIWGYEREWRDTTLGYVKTAPSTQVAMIIDPIHGRLPARTKYGKAQATREHEERARIDSRPPAGPEDLSPYVRCITRGLPGMMMPGVYNNGLQIVQGPGFVTIQKEMIHETRVVPTTQREPLSENLKTWLGDAQGHWKGNTLVIKTNNFNGRAPYQGSSQNMTLIERYTRIGPNLLEYQFTIDDPLIWTSSWTGQFIFDKDDDQYELVEYACHEGNYGMTNILSGARAKDKEIAEATR